MLALKLIRALPCLFLLAVAGYALRCLVRGECKERETETDEVPPVVLKAIQDATDEAYGEMDGSAGTGVVNIDFDTFAEILGGPLSPKRRAFVERIIQKELERIIVR